MSETGNVPANLAPYVEALGVDGAMTLFLELGGSEIYLPKRSSNRSRAAEAIGAERVEALAATLGAGYFKVPIARRWVALTLRQQGKSLNDIARIVRADVATIRRWGLPDPSQLNLF